MALPTLTYGSENWTLTKGQASRIQAAEMRFLRHVAENTLRDHKRNTDIRQELNIMSILDRIAQYRLNWWQLLCRMDGCRTLKQLQYETISRGDGEVCEIRESAWSDQL